LDTQDQENWILGLLEAWALVVDVLSFYQERIANEGYLRTATERRSLLELARAIGYELRPGVSASTYLAFTLRPGLAQGVQLPEGVMVQSVPTQSKSGAGLVASAGTTPISAALPQIFETSAAFEAQSEWNSIHLLNLASRPERRIRLDTTALRLAGVKTGLHKGDALLIVGDALPDDPSTSGSSAAPTLSTGSSSAVMPSMGAPSVAAPSPNVPAIHMLWRLVTIQTVVPNMLKGYT
jgi:hypothetical protein